MENNILLFIDWYLPGTNAGGPVRSVANLTEHLTGFNFFIITRNTDYCETLPYKNIESDSWVRLSKNTSVCYLSSEGENIKSIRGLLKAIDFQVLYINGIYSWKYSILPLWHLKLRNKVIVAPRGMVNPQAFSVKKWKKLIFLKIARLLRFYSGVVFHATNEKEKECIKKWMGNGHDVLIAPNLHRKLDIKKWQQKEKQSGVLKLVSVARVSKEKGTLYALQILAKLSPQENDKISFHIYGPIYDLNYWQKCLEVVEKLPPQIVVEYKGAARGESIPEILKDAHVLFMPSEGENFGHSILEAFSGGCPVIISDKTPWQNLEQEKTGWDISPANQEKFVSALLHFFDMNQAEFDDWSLAAFEKARRFCNNPELIVASEKLFKNG